MSLTRALLYLTRASLLLVLLVPHVTSHDKFMPQLWYQEVTPRNVVFRILVEVMFGLWAVLACLDRRYRPKFSGSLLAFAVFVGVLVVVDSFGVHPFNSIWGNNERMEGLVTHLHLLAMFVVAVSVLNTERAWKTFFHTSLLVCLSLSVFAFLQIAEVYPLHGGQKNNPDYFRVNPRLGQSVYVAVFMVLNLFVAMLYMVREPRRLAQLGYGALGAVFVYTMYLTGTRSAFLAMVAGGLGATLAAFTLAAGTQWSSRIRKLSLVGAATAGVVVAVGVILYVTRPAFLWDIPMLGRMFAATMDASARLAVWNVGLASFWENPLLGWGQENFALAFDKNYDPQLRILADEDLWYDHPHNVFIGWLVAGGVVGLVAYTSLFVVPLRSLWRRGSDALPVPDRSVLIGALVAYGTFNFFMLDNITSYVMFVSLLAYVHVRHTRLSGAPVTEPAEAGSPGEGAGDDERTPQEIAAEADARAAEATPRRWIALPVGVLALVAIPYAMDNPLRSWRAAELIERARATPWIVDEANVPQHQIKIALEAARGTCILTDVRHQAAELAIDSPANVRRQALDLAIRELLALVDETRDAGYPVNLRDYMRLVNVLLYDGQHTRVIAYLEEARAAYPKRQLIYFVLAQALRISGKKDEAAKIAREAYLLAPDYRTAAVQYCHYAAHAGQRAVATQLVDKMHSTKGDRRPPDHFIHTPLVQTGMADLLIPIQNRRLRNAIFRIKNKLMKRRLARDYFWHLAFVQDEAGQRVAAFRTLQELERFMPTKALMAKLWQTRVVRGQAIGYLDPEDLIYKPIEWDMVRADPQERPGVKPVIPGTVRARRPRLDAKKLRVPGGSVSNGRGKGGKGARKGQRNRNPKKGASEKSTPKKKTGAKKKTPRKKTGGKKKRGQAGAPTKAAATKKATGAKNKGRKGRSKKKRGARKARQAGAKKKKKAPEPL